MKTGITVEGLDELLDYVDECYNDWLDSIVDEFISLGLKAERISRGKWEDRSRTGNLCSSIGFCVVKNGKIVHMSGFDVVKTGTQGSSEGQQFIKELASQYPDDIVLIVVAGVEYAMYVESVLNQDVLASAAIMLENEIAKL